MFTFRKSLLAVALLSLMPGLGTAQSNTTIADTVRNPDGSAFNGTVVITWNGTSIPSSAPTPYSTSVKVYNGVFSVSLVPTVAYSALYLAVFNSSDGRISWVENWQVGPSSSPLTLSQVRTTLSTTPTSPNTTVAMAQVTGLNSYLNALSTSVSTVSSTIGGFNSTVIGLNNSVSSLNDRVNTLQTVVSSPNTGTLVEGETPAGTINGANAGFTIVSTPTAASSLMLFRNGILQNPNVDYSLNAKAISFAIGSIPQTGDALQASYRIGAPAQSVTYVDNETPQGAVNGTNLAFSLATAPTSNTLRLYKNGALLFAGADYTLSGANITFANTAATPANGDRLTAYYRLTIQTP